jgi:putative addiction module killer protein
MVWMRGGPRILRIYSTVDGRKPFQEWLDSLKDYNAQARILVRLERVRLGNFGDWKPVGEGMCELRIDVGPGYRVYLGQDAESLVILLCGGSKATQWSGPRF